MKRFILLSICCITGIFMANAQKFALIDMEYIMENIPAYQRANNELEIASQQYQKAVEAKMKEAETLYTAYQKASATMSASQRTHKEEAIIAKEKEAAELRQKYFGPEGEMAKKEETLIAPIQKTKVEYLHGHNPRLHTDEVLVAISLLSNHDEDCRKAIDQLPKLKGCQVHCTVMLSEVDQKIFKRLGIGLTCDPVKKKE